MQVSLLPGHKAVNSGKEDGPYPTLEQTKILLTKSIGGLTESISGMKPSQLQLVNTLYFYS